MMVPNTALRALILSFQCNDTASDTPTIFGFDRTWKKLVEDVPIICDVGIQVDVSTTGGPPQRTKASRLAQIQQRMVDSMLSFPQQEFRPCGNENLLTVPFPEASYQFHLSVRNCFLDIPFPLDSIHFDVWAGTFEIDVLRDDSICGLWSGVDDDSASLGRRITPIPTQFSWEGDDTPSFEVHFDLSSVRRVYHRILERVEANKTSMEICRLSAAPPPTTAIVEVTPIVLLASQETPQQLPTTGPKVTPSPTSEPMVENQSTQKCPTKLVPIDLTNISSPTVDSLLQEQNQLFRENMAILMQKEIDDINSILFAMGILTLGLFLLLVWMAYKSKSEAKRSPVLVNHVGKVVGGKSSGSVSPLSMEVRRGSPSPSRRDTPSPTGNPATTDNRPVNLQTLHRVDIFDSDDDDGDDDDDSDSDYMFPQPLTKAPPLIPEN